MKNIAVMISGHPKGIQHTYKLFKYWNNLYDNINFDFFISVWENDYDEKYFNWATKYEFLKESDCPYDLSNHETGRHQPHYCYALHKVNELKNSHNKDYDMVLQTRSDAILSRKLLDSLVGTITEIRDGLIPEQDNQGNFTGKAIKDTRYNPQISDKNILSATGTFVHNYYDINNTLKQHLWTQDIWFAGTPKVMDIFCNMFNYIFVEKKYGNSEEEPILLHIFQAEYLNKLKIYNSALASGAEHTYLREPERFKFDNDNGGFPLYHPTPNQLDNIINEYGIDWFYESQPENHPELKWTTILNYFENTEKI